MLGGFNRALHIVVELEKLSFDSLTMNFIEKENLSDKSPLYGRLTSQFQIKPFDFFEGRKFLPNYSIEENIKTKILLKSSYLNAEPFNLLKQELREPVFYNSIIESTATGSSKINQIATKVGESTAKVSRYIDVVLVELSIIKKIKPYGEKQISRKTIYKIANPLFAFWYRFVFINSSLVEQEMIDEVYSSFIEPGLSTFYWKTI